MKLSALAQGRDNNFNLIRMLAALAVLVTHSFGITTGEEPLKSSLGLTWGVIAVNVFFVTSGFLVTASLLARNSAVDFIWARVLRIYPALWLMLALSVFGLGILLTSHDIASYLADRGTWRYIVKNALLFAGVEYLLPGVFENHAVNGSLWTLVPEVRIYALLLVLWAVAAVSGRYRAMAFRILVFVTAASSAAVYFHIGQFEPPERNFPRLVFMFFTGASFYVLRERIELSRPVFWALAILLAMSLLNQSIFFYVFNLSLAYILLYAAYGFGGPIRSYNRLGDYSYGFYIYAFPVQQSLALLVPGISAWALLVLSALITFALAAFSWHLLEKRALGLKAVFTERTKSWLRAWRTRLAAASNAP